MAVHYALVARGQQILSEYSPIEGDFATTARSLLKSTEASSVFKTYTQGNKTYNFFTNDNITYLCYADLGIGRDLALQFLNEMQRSFPKYANKAGTFAEFQKKLISQYSPERLHEVDKLSGVERNLNLAVESTKNNLDKVIMRGTHMKTLIKKTDELSFGLSKFSNTARSIQRRAWKQKLKALSLIFIIGIIAIYMFAMWIAADQAE
ncbi:unnamed protein product [Blepharisma stoltei]|uniref:Uncharacterized protein n=1 Tax=Blepharisma stoltei TaxID=1481888 RepID=A0AAU9J7S5_9CILI|nr:unnamed protein product [Blepharisma stoltei]